MGGVTLAGVFFVVWWISLFTVLPLGVKKNTSTVKGVDAGAPEHHRLGRKMLITTGITIVVTALIYYAVEADFISFREMAKGME